MVESCIEPRIHRVAVFAGCRKARRNVIEYGRVEILLVTTYAGGREARELPRSRISVAIVALQQRVRADQGKPVLVIADLIDGDLPSLDRMAALAVGAELPVMDVRMTVSTVRADLLEDKIRVALRAGDLLVHAA